MPRRGWLQRGVPNPETVAAHSFGVAALAVVTASRTGADPAQAALIAVIHDLAEALTGDLTPTDGVSRSEKHLREKEATSQILSDLDPKGIIISAWRDYAEQRTPEGRLVKDLDKVDMALQADVYMQEGIPAATELRQSAESAICNTDTHSLLPQVD